ncbi:YdeI/OmpD-associated family protein [Chryseobacterium chendengshani]|uniref:YdeI/OmpD-associated family protein n=1 Tax=Chryseobacterium sp. LJ668 TaxID=2864040 RepID=UPI001C693B47|nr:YdeI/OmpD-associated family protein [Chryseobacterium sp. LJ668]MBW8521932.1 YdeI/OmpD-associated family protein [Chryseobacterium sp. LJ668]QYK17588.1 YdeI/OmpD-associated family protein [Chryseobacterium sp. LJ668]
MEKYNPQVDEYIEKSQDFAKPILTYLRETVHEFCPDAEEAIKWKFPTFLYKGKILCSITAFKQYCSMGFWLHGEMITIKNLETNAEKSNMFSLGKIKSPEDLPSKIQMKNMILEAMELTDMGVKMKKAAPSKKEIEIPDYFQNVLHENKKAAEVFDKASPSFRKEYTMWITDAKTETTRNKRIEQALEWISEGKGRNWKYEKK